MTAEQYTLKWVYDNKRPTCKCGCGEETKWNIASADFTKYIHGHHAFHRVKTDEEKLKIGKKNSENMKRYMSENPEVAQKRIQSMNAAITPRN